MWAGMMGPFLNGISTTALSPPPLISNISILLELREPLPLLAMDLYFLLQAQTLPGIGGILRSRVSHLIHPGDEERFTEESAGGQYQG